MDGGSDGGESDDEADGESDEGGEAEAEGWGTAGGGGGGGLRPIALATPPRGTAQRTALDFARELGGRLALHDDNVNMAD